MYIPGSHDTAATEADTISFYPRVGIGLMIGYYVFASLLTVMFFRRRHLQPCRSRPCSQMVLFIVGPSILVTNSGLFIMSGDQPCLPSAWVFYLGMVITFTAFDVRMISLYLQHRMVEEQLNLTENSPGSTQPSPKCGAIQDSVVQDFLGQLGASELRTWFIRRHHLFETRYWYLVIATSLVISSLPMGCVCILYPEMSRALEVDCVRTEITPVGVAIATAVTVHGIFLLVMAVLLRNFRDNLGLRTEYQIIFSLVCACATNFAMLIVFADFDEFPYPVKRTAMLAFCATIQFVSFGVPICLSYKFRSRGAFASLGEKRELTLEAVLQSPAGNLAFRRFCEKEFSVENLSFWQEAGAYRKKALAVSRNPRATDLDKKNVYRAAKNILVKYIVPDAALQLNIPSDYVNAVKKKLAGTFNEDQNVVVDPEIFDDISEHIYRLMSMDTFPRFLRSSEAADAELSD